MAKTGRPPKGSGDSGTAAARVRDDLAAMIRWVCDVKGIKSAQFLDPVLRAFVVEQYMLNYELILKLAESRGEATELPIVLGLNAPLNPHAPGEYPTPTTPADPKGGGKADGKAKGKKGK